MFHFDPNLCQLPIGSFLGLCEFYRSRDHRALYVFDKLTEVQHWVERLDTPPRSIAIWSLADQLDFCQVEALEEVLLPKKWTEMGYAPAIGYFAGEDIRQLMWLVFKSLYFSCVRPPLPDCMLLADEHMKECLLTDREGHTISVPQAHPELVMQPIDGLMFLGHGRSFDTHLAKQAERTVTLCTRPHGWRPAHGQSGHGRVAVCHRHDSCFRESDPRTQPHERWAIASLQARFLFLNSCASWRLTGELDPASNVAIRALDGWCCAFIGSRYEKSDSAERMCLAYAAWKAGFSLGDILKLLSPDRVQLYSLLGDPELRRLGYPDCGYGLVEQRPDCWLISDVREGVISVPSSGLVDEETTLVDLRRKVCGVPLPTPPKLASPLEFFVLLPSKALPARLLALTPVRTSREVQDRKIVQQFTDEHDRRRLLQDLLEIDVGESSQSDLSVTEFLIDLGHQVQQSYGPSGPNNEIGGDYWPGPVQEDRLLWEREGAYHLSGHCFACGLPTMRREVLVKPRAGLYSSVEIVKRQEHYCPRCYQITHLPCNAQMTFHVAQDVAVGEPLRIILGEVPEAPCVAWPAIFPIERAAPERAKIVVPAPKYGMRLGECWPIEGGLPEPGLHFVRVYACRLSDLVLFAVGTIVHCN